MADILATATSGLLAFQQALDVTSNNVANVDTPGYTAETTNFAEQPGQGTSTGYIGNGVDVASITRAYNALLAQQANASQSSYSSFNTLGTWASQIDNMLSSSSTGLTTGLQSFVNALQTLSSSPTATASGQAVLGQAQALVQQLQSYSSQISQAQSQVESQVQSNVTEINTLASSIAAVNGQIAAAEGADPSQTPNQLLDQLDGLVSQLSQYVTVNTVAGSDGQQNVYIGTGQALVLGSSAQQLTAIPNAYNATIFDIGLTSGNSTVDITPEVTGGSLGGLLSTVSQVLQPTQNALGQISVGLATLVNQQQADGMDQSGAQGQPMFAVGGPQVLSNVNNTGSASLDVTLTSLSDLTADDYVLRYTGAGVNGGWQLEDQTTGQAVVMTGTGTAAAPLQAAGLSIVASGVPATNDSFLVQPTAAATQGLSVLLTNPSQIASASLVQATATGSNTGTGSISSAAVTDPTTWLANEDTYTISFTSPTQYEVTNSAGTVVVPATAYTSGTPITFEGTQVTLTGAPAAGDSFTLSSNPAANTGDNSNLLAMISSLSTSVLNGGTASLGGAANSLVTNVGTLTQQAQSNASAEQSVNQSATNSLNNADGVNLDQEAALMVQYQQAYQACAQMIAASTTMFDSLITAMTYG